MIIFAQYRFLLLLLLVPLIPLLYALVMRLRTRNIRKFGDVELVKELMPSYSKAKGWLRILLFTLAFALFVKILILVLTAFGLTNMWIAVFGDVGVAVLCILNSMRLLTIKRTI